MTSLQTRKRSLPEDSSSHLPKKRAFTGRDDSPVHVPNGVADEQDSEQKDQALESFRKEAIYRKMKHYSRQYESSQARIAQLEERQRTTEAGIVALESCWNYLVASIRTLMKAEHVPEAVESRGSSLQRFIQSLRREDELTSGVADVFRLTSARSVESMPYLKEALDEKSRATEELVGAFMRHAPNTATRDDVFQRSQTAQAESVTLRSQLTSVRASLEDSEAQLCDCREQLGSAQMKVDRLQRLLARSGLHPSVPGAEHTSSSDSPQNGEIMPEVSPNSENDLSPRNDTVHPVPNDDVSHLLKDNEPFQEGRRLGISESAEKIQSLEREIETLQHTIRHLNAQIMVQDPDEIKKSETYTELMRYTSKLQHQVHHSRQAASELETKLSEIVAIKTEIHFELKNEYEAFRESSRKQLADRDTSIVRLRQQRDQSQAELVERRANDKHKAQALDEMQKLTQSQSERIIVLQSEIKRLRAQLSVEAGRDDILGFILDPNADEGLTYSADMSNRLSVADAKIASLEEIVASYITKHPQVADQLTRQRELQQQLSLANNELASFRRLYGDARDLPADMDALAQKLKSKELQVEKYRLQDIARQQAEAAMETELTKLSTAWEELDSQLKDKVFNLAALEERLSKAFIDKHKSDNKYFAAMREKDAIEIERKKALKALQAQEALTEKMAVSERAHLRKMAEFDQERQRCQSSVEELRRRAETFERTAAQATAYSNEVREKMTLWRNSNVDLQKTVDDLKKETKTLKEDLVQARKEGEREAAKASKANAPSSVREADVQKQLDQAMSILKCSCCKNSMRSTVITKCMHSFCKDCVESRLTTRQRKCPACGLAFGTQDVQTFYFQ